MKPLRIKITFAGIFFLLMASFSDFSLPPSQRAVLKHFLAMSPLGIYQNIVQTDNSPIRHAYYAETARKGFLSQPAMPIFYFIFLMFAVQMLRQTSKETQ